MTDRASEHLGRVRGDVLVLRPRGTGGMLKRAARMAFDGYRDPEALVAAFDDVRRDDLLSVLKKDSEAFMALWTAIRSHLSTEEVAEVEHAAEVEGEPDALDRVVAAIQTNRAAVVAGFREERTAVASALKGKSEVFEVLTSLYLPLAEVQVEEVDPGPPALVVLSHEGTSFVAEVSDGDAVVLRSRTGNEDSAIGAGSFGDLERLAELHRSGVLTDEEFAAAKRRALGI